MNQPEFKNPYKPGAGHAPPHLAGREREYEEFDQLLEQDEILKNVVLTGLRGVGKTVLLETFKPRAVEKGWFWATADLSESASISEVTLAQRLLADLSLITSSLKVKQASVGGVGFAAPAAEEIPVSHGVLMSVFESTPGLVSDRIKATLEFAWEVLREQGPKQKVIFAYDEAQNLSDHASKDQFPLSVLLDVFQSIQKKGIPFMLVLAGLPTLFPKLVDARTYAERMFRVMTLTRLDTEESREAILRPIQVADCPINFVGDSVEVIVFESGGYPYFIQFICREVFDIFIQQNERGELGGTVPIEAIQQKLDADFFAGRWARVTDRQKELLLVVAHLDEPDDEFTIQELVEKSKEMLDKSFSSSHANQMLASLSERGMIYKNRVGKYSFAVPLLGRFIRRIDDRGPEAASAIPAQRLF